MKPVSHLSGLFAALAVAGGAHADARPKPGYWETTNKATVVFSSKKTERRCLVASEINRFMTSPSNRHYTCTYPDRTVGDGKIRLKGSCATKKGQVALVTATGAYSATTLHLDMALSTRIGGIPLSGKASTDARRLGDVCPPDAVYSDEARAELGKADDGQ